MSAKDESRRIIEMWRRWRESHGANIASNTIPAFRNAFVTYIAWMQSNSFAIASMDRKKWEDFCIYVSHTKESTPEYRRVKIKVARTMLHFLFDVNAIDDFETSIPRRAKVKAASGTTKLPLIPVYKDIQRFRRTEVRLEDAMLFEFGISSGLRRDELLSVRMCDVNMSKKAIDISTGVPSVHCGGTVTVSTMVSSTKGKRDRLTYISPLAARLVRVYARVNSVKLDSQIPLFMSRQRIMVAFDSFNDDMEWSASMDKGIHTRKTEDPVDLGESFLALPAVMRAAYIARVKREREATHVPSGRKEGDRLTTHSMRYFFTSLMLYRTYAGHRNSIERVMELLGHSAPTITMYYLKKLSVIESDSEWGYVMLGTSSSWLNIKMNKVADIRLGKNSRPRGRPRKIRPT